MVRICFFAHSFPPTIGGGETHIFLIAKGLGERGHEVTVITGSPPGDSTVDASLPFRVIHIEGFREFEMGQISLRDFLPRVKEALLRFSYDIVHVHNFMPGLAYAVVEPLMQTRTVFTFHSTPVPEEGKIIGHYPDWQTEEAFARFVLRLPFYRMVVCPSRYYNAWATRLGVPTEKRQLVYHGVDAERFQLVPDSMWRSEHGFTDRDFILVCAARMIERKGILDLLASLRHISDDNIKVYLTTSVMQGSPQYWRRVRAYIKDNRLDSRVRVAVDQDTMHTMPRVLVNSDALVLPSHVEGLGVVLLEGMAAGVPVIGSATHGINEVIRHGMNGLVFRPRDPEDMAEKISLLTADRLLVKRLVEGGRRSVAKRFALWRQIDTLEHIYRDREEG